MKHTWILLIIAVFMGLSLMAQVKIIYLHNETVPCFGTPAKPCLQFRYSTNSKWQIMKGNINGFVHEDGYAYRLRITEKKMAHGPSIQRKLIQVLSKKPAQPHVEQMPGEWIIKDLLMNKALTTVLQEKYTVTISDSSIHAKICNSIRGKLHIAKDGTVQAGPLISTKMICNNIIHETALMQALEKAIQWEVKNGNLYMMDTSGKVYAVLTQQLMEAPPAAPANINYEALLSDSRFTVIEIEDNKGITSLSGTGAFLQIDKVLGRISGNGGCNNFFGDAAVQFTSPQAGSIRFSKLGSTMMACPNKLEQEQRLFRLLEQADAFQFADGELQLKRGSQIIVRLRAE